LTTDNVIPVHRVPNPSQAELMPLVLDLVLRGEVALHSDQVLAVVYASARQLSRSRFVMLV
jgi:hypothetical protein